MANNNRPGMLNVNDIAEKAAHAALKKFRHEEREKKKKSRLYNTELLLWKYNELREHIEDAVASYSDIEDPDFATPDEIDNFDLYIEAIGRCKFRSAIMLTHIDVCLKKLKLEYPDKFVLIAGFYFQGMTIEEIADSIPCSVSTAHRWKKDLVEVLSVKFFGAEGLRLDL